MQILSSKKSGVPLKVFKPLHLTKKIEEATKNKEKRRNVLSSFFQLYLIHARTEDQLICYGYMHEDRLIFDPCKAATVDSYYHQSKFDTLLYRTISIFLERPNVRICLLYTSPSPRDRQKSRMPSSA